MGDHNEKGPVERHTPLRRGLGTRDGASEAPPVPLAAEAPTLPSGLARRTRQVRRRGPPNYADHSRVPHICSFTIRRESYGEVEGF